MKNNTARALSNLALCLCLFLVFGVATGRAEDYFVYHDRDGKLFISNKTPPAGSKIIKRHDFALLPDMQTQKGQEAIDTKVIGGIDGLLKPSK